MKTFLTSVLLVILGAAGAAVGITGFRHWQACAGVGDAGERARLEGRVAVLEAELDASRTRAAALEAPVAAAKLASGTQRFTAAPVPDAAASPPAAASGKPPASIPGDQKVTK